MVVKFSFSLFVFFILIFNFVFLDPTLNTLNNTDLNTSFDHFVKNIKLASNGEVNWNLNDIDTTQFKSNLNILKNKLKM